MRGLKIFFILIAQTAWCQFNYNIKNLTPDNGFVNSCVHDISTDSIGTLYFSTELGISKYDGKEFENKFFKDGLKENIIIKTLVNGDKTWYLAHNKGLFYLQNNKNYTTHPNLTNSVNFYIHGDELISMESNRVVFYELGNDKKIIEKKLYELNNVTPINVFNYKSDDYIITQNGLYIINAKLKKAKYLLDSKLTYYCGYKKDSLLYIAREREILSLNMNTGKINSIHKNVLIEKLNVLFVDQENNIWFSSINENNLYFIKNNVFFNMNYIFNHNPPVITCFYQDFQSNIWISTYCSGVFKLTEKKLLTINNKDGLKNGYVSCLEKIGDNLFIGTSDGVYKYNYSQKIILPFYGIDDKNDFSFIYKLVATPNNNIIINTVNVNRVALTDNKSSSSILLSKYRCSEKINDSVYALAGWDGRVGFLNLKSRKLFGEYILPQFPIRTRIHCIRFLSSNAFLCASDEGLFKVWFSNDFKILGYENISSIPKRRINDIIRIDDGYYIGGLGVFAKVSKELKVEFIKGVSGKETHEILSFAYSEKDKLLFIASLNGLFKINLVSGIEGKILLDNDQSTQGITCLLFDKEKNKLIAGTYKGVDIYDSGLFNPNVNPYLRPPIVVGYRVNEGLMMGYNGKSINIDHKTNRLYLKVSSPNYEHSNSLKFKFELIGEDSLSLFTEFNFFNLSDIPYGITKLKISTTFDSQIFSKPLIVKIIKQKPWYYSASGIIFISLVLISFFGFILWLSVRIYKKATIKKFSAQAKLNKLTLMAYNRTMSPHFVFNVLSNIQGLINTNEIELANDYLVTFSKLLRKSIEIIQKETININEEIQFLRSYILLETMRVKNSIKINLHNNISSSEANALFIPPMLIQPLIENSLKHGINSVSIKPTIDIEFKTEVNNLIIIVKDNGEGIKESKISSLGVGGVFGIKSIYERLQNYEGSSFTISNIEEGGVKNEVIIPINAIKKM